MRMKAKDAVSQRPEWLTKELLAEHEVPPSSYQADLVDESMNTHVEGVDFWAIGKHLQWNHPDGNKIPFKAEYEVAAGYWYWIREQLVSEQAA